MDFTGENFILTPTVQEMTFVFDGLVLSNDGVAEIGFSGAGFESAFTFSGKRLIDPNGNYAYSYETGIPITISGDIKGGSEYRYSIDDVRIGDGLVRPQSFSTEKFFVRTTDCVLSADVGLSSPTIDYNIQFSPTFIAGGEITGAIVNYSNSSFRVFGSYFSDSNTFQNITGNVSGDVPANSSLSFTLVDTAPSYATQYINSELNLQTSFGLISTSVTSERVSGFVGNLSNFNLAQTNISSILPYFSGSGNASGFTWMPFDEQNEEFSLYYQSLDEDGKSIDKNLSVRLENVSPETGVEYTGTYAASYFTYLSGHEYCVTGIDTPITGVKPIWQCSGEIPGSGRYFELPSVEFATFSKITGATFNENNLFTQDTPSKIPILFSGYPGELGTGASGFFLTEDIEINLYHNLPLGHSDNTPDGSNTSNWKKIVGVELTSFGSGYTKLPALLAATGLYDSTAHGSITADDSYWDNTVIGGTGYDVGKRRAPYVFSAFTAEPLAQLEAAYITGIPYFKKTGEVYLFSGVHITNPGSGYDATYRKPFLRFTRHANDTLGSEDGDVTSGEFLFNTSGTLYKFHDSWNLETGAYDFSGLGVKFLENDLTLEAQYSGSSYVPAENQSFFAKVYFNNLDIDEPLVSKLIVEGENQAEAEFLISGKNAYSAGTGMGYITPVMYSDGTNLYNKTYFGS